MSFRFGRRKLPGNTAQWYRRVVDSHPFLLFGLPFVSIVVAASFIITPATALRYEKHDAKHRWMTNKEAMDQTGLKKRKFDPREEYYRLGAKDLDDWEQRRVKRLDGEMDGVIE